MRGPGFKENGAIKITTAKYGGLPRLEKEALSVPGAEGLQAGDGYCFQTLLVDFQETTDQCDAGLDESVG